MGWFEKLLKILKIKKDDTPQIEAVNEERNEVDVGNENSLDRYKVTKIPSLWEPSFYDCTEEFIKRYDRISAKSNRSNSDRIYDAFISMFCKEEEAGDNLKNQQNLIEYAKANDYTKYYQMSNGVLSFIHIFGEDKVDKYRDRHMNKVYINCDRRNIALITHMIIENIKDIVGDRLYIKCAAEQILDRAPESEEIKSYQRNDKIVLYLENSQVTEMVAERINEIKLTHPELFSSEKMIPFLPKKNGIMAVAKDMPRYAYTPLGTANGETENDLMAGLLYKCIAAGFEQYKGIDSATQEGDLEERMTNYINEYKQMDGRTKYKVLMHIRSIFSQVCQENNIDTVYSNFRNPSINYEQRSS